MKYLVPVARVNAGDCLHTHGGALRICSVGTQKLEAWPKFSRDPDGGKAYGLRAEGDHRLDSNRV
jgi:hypothetical protein